MLPRLLLIHQHFGFQGGAEQYLFSISEELSQRFELHLIYATGTGKREADFAAPFTSVSRLADINAGLDAYIESLKPQLIYLHKCTDPLVFRGALDSGIPAIRMVHDHDVYCMRSYKYFPWSREPCNHKAGSACFIPCMGFVQRDRNANCLGVKLKSWSDQKELIELDQKLHAHLVGSHFMRTELIRQGYDAEKIHIVPPVPRPMQASVSSDFAASNHLLFIGQIIRGKGLDCLIRALQKVDKPFHLYVLGEGSHRSHCERLADSLGLSDRISFKGFLPHSEMLPYFEHASAVVFPSVWPEPFGAVGLEVMRWGIPVVGFDAGGVRDWLVDGVSGRLVENRNIPALSRAINNILGDKEETRRLGLSAKGFVQETFNFESILERQSQLLKSLMQLA
ncbi:MAG: glycosyltransferase family 4 protein [Chlamydiia bacterium]|nr:glycosyltransferase family 4 protein [Chlamydiia bacterium]